jgi:hypothetical protein
MGGGHKKVIVRKFNRDWICGYLSVSPPSPGSAVGVLDLAGKLIALPLSEVKWICYVREFNLSETDQPERLLRKRFHSRPRAEGLWIRVQLRDKDSLEGLAQNDATLLEGDGLFLVPPDPRSNTQRIFIPRQAVTSMEILAVVRTGGARRAAAGAAPLQESLFREAGSAE